MKCGFYTLIFLAFNWHVSLFSGIKFVGVSGSVNVEKPSAELLLGTNLTGFNGTLKIRDVESNNVSSVSGDQTIDFIEQGALDVGVSSHAITGGYNPHQVGTIKDQVILRDSEFLVLSAGHLCLPKVLVDSNANAKLEGNGSISEQIVLTDFSSQLQVALTATQNYDFVLNGGTLVLATNLALKKDVKIQGPGILRLDGHILNISGQWNGGNLTFQDAGTVQLFGNIIMPNNWEFTGVGARTVIQGNGHSLDLSAGGSLEVGAGHELVLLDLCLKGLGVGAAINLFDSATVPGKIVLQNVTIELAGNFTLGSGQMIFNNGSSKIIVTGLATLEISGANTLVIIDNVVVYYETLEANPNNPFVISNNGDIEFYNQGKLRSTYSNSSFADLLIDAASWHLQTYYFSSSPKLHLNSRVVVINTASPNFKQITIDGGGVAWSFPQQNSTFFQVDPDIEVILKNVILDGFSWSKVLLGAGANVLFGDGVVIKPTADFVLPQAGKSLNCVGDVLLQGAGNNLPLTNDAALIVSAANKTLTLEKLQIGLHHSTALVCQNDMSTIKFKNCELLLKQNDFNFNQGNLQIQDQVQIINSNGSAASLSANFNFNSSGTLQINAASNLMVKNNVNLVYNADPVNDGLNLVAAKRHWLMQDKTSMLSLFDCSLISSGPGLALDQGNLIVDGKVVLTASALQAQAMELGAGLHVHLQADANLVLQGQVLSL